MTGKFLFLSFFFFFEYEFTFANSPDEPPSESFRSSWAFDTMAEGLKHRLEARFRLFIPTRSRAVQGEKVEERVKFNLKYTNFVSKARPSARAWRGPT